MDDAYTVVSGVQKNWGKNGIGLKQALYISEIRDAPTSAPTVPSVARCVSIVLL